MRIYVLWHPNFERGEALAMEIYKWFRLDNKEGIPVYFRSTPLSSPAWGENSAPPPIWDDAKLAKTLSHRDISPDYIIPLVEANMVADPEWRQYVGQFLPRDPSLVPTVEQRLYPVALDSLAYNLPPHLRRLNFIRHDLEREPDRPLMALLSQLTEVLCRDLRAYLDRRLGKTQAGGLEPPKIRLFLSHAKADGTAVPTRLKEFIQNQTRCETFFDETDIAAGIDYSDVLDNALRESSAGLIVIHGDHYADRPWCREEVRRFQQPLKEEEEGGFAYFIPPLVVVQNMNGGRIARTIPELGNAPCIRWGDGKEEQIVTTLLREILLGLFYRCLMLDLKSSVGLEPGVVMINRTPDPVLVQHVARRHLLDQKYKDGKKLAGKPAPIRRVVYPGYGLSKLELRGLEKAYSGFIHFKSYSQFQRRQENDVLSRASFRRCVLQLSLGNAPDLVNAGLSDEHTGEFLLRLLRPLCSHHLSLMYGGAMPDPEKVGIERKLNFTSLLLGLLMSERSEQDEPGADRKRNRSGTDKKDQCPARLYNAATWPDTNKIDHRTIAQWIDVCSFRKVLPEDAEVERPNEAPMLAIPGEGAPDFLTREELRKLHENEKAEIETRRLTHQVARARCLTFMRQESAKGLFFPVPDIDEGGSKTVQIKPFAHLFMGGRIGKSSGAGPGIFEEFLYASEAKTPIFIIGAGYGAAGQLASWLLAPPPDDPDPKKRPEALKVDFYRKDDNFQALQLGLAKIQNAELNESQGLFDKIWEIVKKGGVADSCGSLKGFLNNGLEEEDNRKVLDPQTSYRELCRIIWGGLRNLASKSKNAKRP